VDDPTTSAPSSLDRAAEEHAQALVGRVVSQRYRIDALIAVGGMGAVYRGRHQHLKKRVAVKVLRPETENLPELVTRFEREAIAGAHVVHPNVAAATDFGQLEDGSYFLVLEYVSGKTLHEVIRDEAPVTARRAVRIARQIADALAAVHAMGIVHRDMKPRNVMLVDGTDDLAKLIDFGFAKVPLDQVVHAQSKRPPAGSRPDVLIDGLRPPKLPRMRADSLMDDAPRLTASGMIVGTVSYLAPEAVLGMDAVDARADLYALGLMLYQLLAGKHPFDADDDATMFTHQRLTPPPSFAERAPDARVPLALEAVVMKLLEKDPAARYPTAHALIEALDFADRAGATLPTRPPKTLRDYAPAVVASAALGIGLAAFLIHSAASPGPPQAAAETRGGAPRAPAATEAPAPAAPPVAAPPATSLAGTTPPPASAEPAASAATVPEGARAAITRAIRVRDLPAAEAAFIDLAEHEPDALKEPEIAVATRDLAVALDRDGKADRMFDLLTSKLGPAGLDVLYDLVATRGRAGAALRAATVLRRPDVIKRASPALRIAFELREAPCVSKLGLLDRAVNEGDARVLVVLETQGQACFRKSNRAMQEAMAALRTKLRRGP
jgi:serine/threonine-protein kinase